jgi:hypothetical protein
MSKRRRTLPPLSAKLPREQRDYLKAIGEITETGEGVRGDPLDQKVTLRDLLESGIGQRKKGASVRPGAAIGSIIESGASSEEQDRSTPPPPEGFNAEGSHFGNITLTWDKPEDLYNNHAFTNIYRHSSDNFSKATLVGRDTGLIYTDSVNDTAPDDNNLPNYYYWITFTSTAGVEGPPHSTDGQSASPEPDAGYLLETLSKNLADEPADLGSEDETLILQASRLAVRVGPDDDPVYPLIVDDVDDTPTVVLDTAIIRDGSIEEGKLGPITIGKVEDNDGDPITTVDGLIRADAIDVDNLQVAEASTFTGVAQSTNWPTAGWRLHPDGSFGLKSAGSGARVEQDAQGIRVYDGSGLLRVKMGQL